MKFIIVVFCCLAAIASAQTKYVPTPEMAMSWDMGKDGRKWVPQYQNGDAQRMICELVPEGQAIDAWKEMGAQQIEFTPKPLREYFDVWKALLLQSDPKIKITEETMEDGSILATYISYVADEASIRRFFKANDGIYMLAYHVRPGLRTDAVWKLWRNVIADANLIPNPEKRK